MKKELLEGLITPIVTPFNRDEKQTINYEATKDLIEYLIGAGVDGVFVLGSNGEFFNVSKEEKIEFTRNVVKIVNGRIPVYAGPGSCSTIETIEVAKEMEKAGASALSVISPYFVKLTEDELYEHYKAVASNVNIPIILYNIPRMTGNPISKGLFERLSDINNIVGVKDSSRDIDNFKGYIEIAQKKNLKVLIGSDGMISEAYALGASGAIAGMSNVIPSTMVRLIASLESGDSQEAKKMQEEVNYIRSINKLATMPVVLKRALELSGIAAVGPARKPTAEASPELDKTVIELINHFDLKK